MSVSPSPGAQAPDLAGFYEAQDRKRALLGSNVVFFWPPVMVYPSGTPLSAETGQPYDPTVVGTASGGASATIRCSAFFKAINRGGASNSEKSDAIGHDEITRTFLNLASADGLTIKGIGPNAPASGEATFFEFHGDQFQVYAIKDDEVVNGYVRTLVYGAGMGADDPPLRRAP